MLNQDYYKGQHQMFISEHIVKVEYCLLKTCCAYLQSAKYQNRKLWGHPVLRMEEGREELPTEVPQKSLTFTMNRARK